MADLSLSRLGLGATVEDGGVRFRVFAPKCKDVRVALDGEARELTLDRNEKGLFSAVDRRARAGTRYKLRLDGEMLVPDPASRFQPDGPHGFSQVVDLRSFRWTDEGWKGISRKGQVLYELHLGTFTREGTYAAAMRELEELKRVGITAIELMPLAEFPGKYGWGYDGVQIYAPFHHYGSPADLCAFVDRAHALGLGVILDVVYNHFGPDGNYLHLFAEEFFTDVHKTDWGRAIDFETRSEVRSFFLENAEYWIRDYHFDGLRLDATQNIYDSSEPHILAEIVRSARSAAGSREIIVVAENEPQEARIVRPKERGGYGADALWNDDLHHSAIVALTGRNEAYYQDTKGTPQELLSAIKWGYLFQGQYYAWQKQRRGAPALDVDPSSFITFLENHDQVANSTRGERPNALAAPGSIRALTTLLLLAPGTPMLFQGQEFGSRAPFLFFVDHNEELAPLVDKGRAEFLLQFPSARDATLDHVRFAPSDPRGFEASKLDFTDRTKNAGIYAFHRELLSLRKRDPIFSAQRNDWLHGAVLSRDAFMLRYALGTGDDRLIVVNLGADLDLVSVAEPLLAPPEGTTFEILFSTEDPKWGGNGVKPLGPNGEIYLSARSALVLGPKTDTSSYEDPNLNVEGP